MLWHETQYVTEKSGSGYWTLLHANTTAASCESDLQATIEARKKKESGLTVDGNLVTRETSSNLGRTLMAWRYVCLPETVDPRESKR